MAWFVEYLINRAIFHGTAGIHHQYFVTTTSHPYTEGLLKSIPRLDSTENVLWTIPGNPPNLLSLPVGCPYQDRCHRVMDRCKKEAPVLIPFAEGRSRACFSDWESWS